MNGAAGDMLEEGVRTGDLSVGGDVGVTLRCTIYTVGVGMVHELCSARTVSAALCVQRLSSERPLSEVCAPSPRRPWVLVSRQVGVAAPQDIEETSVTVSGLQVCHHHHHHLGYSHCHPESGWSPVVCPPDPASPHHHKGPKRLHRGHRSRKGQSRKVFAASGDESREAHGERPRIAKKIDLGFYKPDEARRIKRQADTKPEDVESILLRFRSDKKITNRDGSNEDDKDVKVEQLVDEPDVQKAVTVEGEQQQNRVEDSDTKSDDQQVTPESPQSTEVSDEEKGPVFVVASGPIFVHDALPIPAQKDEQETATGKGTVVEVDITQTENALIEASLADESAEEHMDESFSGVEVSGEAEEQSEPVRSSDGQDDAAETANRPIIFPEDPQPSNPDPTRSLINERGMDEGYPISSGQDVPSGDRGSEGTPRPASSIIFPHDTPPSDHIGVESLAHEEEGPAEPQVTTVQTEAVVPVIRDAMPDLTDMEMNPEINEIQDTDDAPEAGKMADKPEMGTNGMSEKPSNEDPAGETKTDDAAGKPATEDATGTSAADDMVEDTAEKPTVDKTAESATGDTESRAEEGAEDPAITEKETPVTGAKPEALSDPGPSQHSNTDGQTGRQPLISQIFKGLFG
ncbi:uncharacterized protein LOC119577106 [Penaeus monodon]|uniref:uncharacterized protein LOC119577106 n=1 Tax=Penaeus monodon TaxID=6687 RepID=UPI0018A76209|nr:uncharacterized protein LOC119577106 [Penaeus monodon]